MNFAHAILTALANLRVNKLRATLTMLGIIIGVGAVIVMVAIVQGAASRVRDEFARLGSNLIVIYYLPDYSDRRASARSVEGLTLEDVEALQARGDLIGRVSAEIPLQFKVPATYLDKQMEVSPIGVQAAYERLRNVRVARGRFITDDDLETWAKVCVIGEKVRQELFEGEDPLGKEMVAYGVTLTVVGVLEPKGKTFEGDPDRSVFLPLTTIQKRYAGRDVVGVVWAEPKDPDRMDETLEEIWRLLMLQHDNLPGFHVDSQESVLASINKVLAIFGVILGSIAGLALLVGGIGIMNIMLVSVTERTREIGIRKAVGAKRRDILWQFLIEAATVSGIGGIIGIAFGAAVAYAIGYATQFIPLLDDPVTGRKGLTIYLPLGASLGAFLFSASIGIFFGIYPALRAARLDPIEALRHE